MPQTTALHAAYPNPFNPQTQIQYTLAVEEPVRLAVYDVLGRAVAVLVDREEGTGRHEAVFEARGLASGVYVYRLETAGQVTTGRLILQN